MSTSAIRRTLVTLAIGAAVNVASGPGARLAAQAKPGQPQQLVYAIYDGTGTANQVFPTVTAPGQPGQGGAFAAIANEGKGGVTVQQSKASGLAQTALLSGIIGLLGPQGAAQPTGAAPTSTVVDSLRSSLVPGTSAIVAIVDEAPAPAVASLLQQAKPRQVMSARVAATSAP
jgi:NADPH-dependent ferric siderophore reductase